MERQVCYNALPSVLITILCVWLYYADMMFCFEHNSHMVSHFLYHFSHANIFHLLGNLIALWYFRPRWSTCLVGLCCASLASIIPFASLDVPTCGLSAFIYAAYARKYYMWCIPLRGIFFSMLVTAFVPMMNWRIHLLSFAVAYAVWMVYDFIRVWHKGIDR